MEKFSSEITVKDLKVTVKVTNETTEETKQEEHNINASNISMEFLQRTIRRLQTSMMKNKTFSIMPILRVFHYYRNIMKVPFLQEYRLQRTEEACISLFNKKTAQEVFQIWITVHPEIDKSLMFDYGTYKTGFTLIDLDGVADEDTGYRDEIEYDEVFSAREIVFKLMELRENDYFEHLAEQDQERIQRNSKTDYLNFL